MAKQMDAFLQLSLRTGQNEDPRRNMFTNSWWPHDFEQMFG
jgi:hypothetical protein